MDSALHLPVYAASWILAAAAGVSIYRYRQARRSTLPVEEPVGGMMSWIAFMTLVPTLLALFSSLGNFGGGQFLFLLPFAWLACAGGGLALLATVPFGPMQDKFLAFLFVTIVLVATAIFLAVRMIRRAEESGENDATALGSLKLFLVLNTSVMGLILFRLAQED